MLLEIRVLPRNNPTGRGKPPELLVLRCDVCGNIFERTRKKHGALLKRKRHYCKPRCFYDDPVVKEKKMTGEIVNCSQCKKEMYSPKNALDQKWGNFCDRTCYRIFRSENKHLYEDNIKAMQTPDAQSRANATKKSQWKSGEKKHPRLGVKHTKETKKKISEHHVKTGCLKGAKNGMHGRCHTEQSKQKMSDTRTRKMLSGEITHYGKKGHHKTGTFVSKKAEKSFIFRSGWEEAMIKYLEQSDDVAIFEFESVRIPYHYRNNKRWYIPDFIVTYTSGQRTMYEIKPKEFVNNEKTKKKTFAGQSYCKMHGINEYKILTRDELTTMGVL